MSRDLFGEDTAREAPAGSVMLALMLHGERPRAWLLGPTRDGREAKWIPKSKCTRGEGRDENVWTLPVWLARDRGWL